LLTTEGPHQDCPLPRSCHLDSESTKSSVEQCHSVQLDWAGGKRSQQYPVAGITRPQGSVQNSYRLEVSCPAKGTHVDVY
jgi:hypothetical protein